MFKIGIFILLCFNFFCILPRSSRNCLSESCKNGNVVFIDSYGNKYKGIFINGKLEGYAEVEFKNRGTFSGIYKNPSVRGSAKLIETGTGKVIYGTWVENGDCDERGCKSWTEFIADSDVECIFQGTFRGNQKVGKGSYTCANGESFDGIYENDFANGYGKLRYSDGTVFEGEFKNGYPISKKKSNEKGKSKQP
ncbi:membrane-binding protein [Leptospira barantonii]|uniref:Membrane-binding protein n=1 Tax=Leptospira barantonii TaxID=2023184 RepID=A0A5F2AXC1_9LEPT|nr:membrane-binding protein [Leptospira barantonii]TGL92191.1 membrane-binding protein [Leptospira barantonii]